VIILNNKQIKEQIQEVRKDIENAYGFIDHYFLASESKTEMNITKFYDCDIQSSIEDNEDYISLYAEKILSFHIADWKTVKKLYNERATLTRLDDIYFHYNKENKGVEAILHIFVL